VLPFEGNEDELKLAVLGSKSAEEIMAKCNS
jgi:hypothetical protein